MPIVYKLTTLIAGLKEVLETVNGIKKVYAYPESKFEKYPVIVFTNIGYENSFETTKENKKNYIFKIWILMQANQTNLEEIYESVMPKRIDEVSQAIDNAYNLTVIDGHRAWAKIDSVDRGVSEEQNGHVVWTELNLDIQLLTNNS